MNIQEYQDTIHQLQVGRQEILNTVEYSAIALAGEVGEALNLIKKSMRGDTVTLRALEMELGDVLYYLAKLSTALGFSMAEIAALNVAKVREFKSWAS